jgi:hypothetical protein
MVYCNSLLVMRDHDYDVYYTLTPLASPQPHILAVLLQLGDQSIALLDEISVLLVLVIRAVRLDDSVDAVDRARYPLGGNEFGQVPRVVNVR